MKLAGQVALVTGASRGIGRAIALEQAREGARIALLARSGAEIEAVAAEIVAAGGSARAWAGDVLDLAAMMRLVHAIETELGAITLVTNNAASFRAIGPIWKVDPDAWWQDVETNLRGPFNVSRAVLPGMLERGR